MCSDACGPGRDSAVSLTHIQQVGPGASVLTECSSESDVWEVMTGLKLAGEMGLSFFLMARICSRALKAKGKHET